MGLLHFYRKDDKWHYVTSDELKNKKLPDLCFATYAPVNMIKDIDKLIEVQNQLTDKLEKVDNPDHELVCNMTQEPIKGVLYISKCKNHEYDAADKMSLCETAALSGHYPARSFQPRIWLRITSKLKSDDDLPTLKLSDYFPASAHHESKYRITENPLLGFPKRGFSFPNSG